MGQRVMIAIMLIAEPDLLIADEADLGARRDGAESGAAHPRPISSSARGMGLIFISHNLTVIASFCDRVLVMYRRAHRRGARRHAISRRRAIPIRAPCSRLRPISTIRAPSSPSFPATRRGRA